MPDNKGGEGISRDEVVSLARSLFGELNAPRALELIDAYGVAPHEREINRVKREILAVSEGKLSRLPYFVACAKIDYRDVLTGARLAPMTEEEEARWQASADRMLERWKLNPP
jgi:hypothetical protein